MIFSQSKRVYVVEGMSCRHCERSLTEEVQELAGVESAKADRTTGRLVVRGDAIDDSAVREAVEAAGYSLAASGAGKAEDGALPSATKEDDE